MLKNHYKLSISLLVGILFLACQGQVSSENTTTSVSEEQAIVKPTKVGELPLPIGYARISVDSNSVGYYLRHLSLKQDNKVYLYNGSLKGYQGAQYAVLDIDVGDKDLQQCADATMRLRAEYLFHNNQKDKIQFHFTSGHLAKWSSYSDGYRPKISGSNVSWVKTAQKDTSYACFRRYMNLVFSYCGTRSMDKEVTPISSTDIQIGDVFHQTGNPYGHAVTVMDVAVDSAGNKIFMLSQSYMPAQSIHILKNPISSDVSPWYRYKDGQSLRTPEWTFPPNSLKRWKP